MTIGGGSSFLWRPLVDVTEPHFGRPRPRFLPSWQGMRGASQRQTDCAQSRFRHVRQL